MKLELFVATGAALLAWIGSRKRYAPATDLSPQPSDHQTWQTFTLRDDVPEFGLRRGERFVVCPDDLIYLGDVVALKNAGGGVVLARYHDEFIGCVAGLIRRIGTGAPA